MNETKKSNLNESFNTLKAGDYLVKPLSDVNVSSYRTRAGELNRAAGYTKYSVSVDAFTGTLRIIHNRRNGDKQ